MAAQPDQQPNQSRNIELLAQEFRLPFYEVALLYHAQISELGVDARIRNFLPVFAAKNVRKLLLQRLTLPRSAMADSEIPVAMG